jgi:hypothetical protein
MVIFEDKAYPIDMLYLKVAGIREVISLPFIEAMAILINVSYKSRESINKSVERAESVFVIEGDTETEKQRVFTVTKPELIKRLQMDIYKDEFKITDLAIQPRDEFILNEIREFINQL